MKRVFAVTAVLALLCLGSLARADVFNLGPGLTNLETVSVGDAGNAVDYRYCRVEGNIYCGSVPYTYNIGKYEVTAGQYTAFLNAVAKTDSYGLYNASMLSSVYGCKIQQTGISGDYSYSVASDYANRPVNYVSFWDSCRFANWLSNGQKSGASDATTTEDGAYSLYGYTGLDGRSIQRNVNWNWAVTNEDEWYKAAYYKGGGTNAGYWQFPTQSDATPGRDLDDVSGNNANYYDRNIDPYVEYPIQSPYYTTVAGEFQNSDSAYGTFDQGGNVWEWSETFFDPINSADCVIRGGGFEFYIMFLSPGDYGGGTAYSEDETTGFRVVQAVPEPSSFIAGAALMMPLLARRRRRGK